MPTVTFVTSSPHQIVLFGQSLEPKARTASEDGAARALIGGSSWGALIHIGTWTDGTHTFTIEVKEEGAPAFVAADPAVLSTTDHEFQQFFNASGQLVVDDATQDGKIYAVQFYGYGTNADLRVKCEVTGSPTTGLTSSAVIFEADPYVAGAAPMNKLAWATKGGD